MNDVQKTHQDDKEYKENDTKKILQESMQGYSRKKNVKKNMCGRMQ